MRWIQTHNEGRNDDTSLRSVPMKLGVIHPRVIKCGKTWNIYLLTSHSHGTDSSVWAGSPAFHMGDICWRHLQRRTPNSTCSKYSESLQQANNLDFLLQYEHQLLHINKNNLEILPIRAIQSSKCLYYDCHRQELIYLLFSSTFLSLTCIFCSVNIELNYSKRNFEL